VSTNLFWKYSAKSISKNISTVKWKAKSKMEVIETMGKNTCLNSCSPIEHGDLNSGTTRTTFSYKYLSKLLQT
jgi:hypothetical protein